MFKKFLGYNTSSSIQCNLHLTDLFVNVFHKLVALSWLLVRYTFNNTHLNNKVHQFVLVHLFSMEVCDQEADVVALCTKEDHMNHHKGMHAVL